MINSKGKNLLWDMDDILPIFWGLNMSKLSGVEKNADKNWKIEKDRGFGGFWTHFWKTGKDEIESL